MILKVGDKVKIRKDSCYYNRRNGKDYGYSANPYEMIGKVIQNNRVGEYIYQVRWENGACNQYRENDIGIWGYPINAINKLLYPDYIEKGGYLVHR